MNIAIIGYGSIGQRHEKNCLALGHLVDVLSRHEGKKLKREKYDLVIICSKTSEHISDIKKFKDLSENFLIEKPLCGSFADGQSVRKLFTGKKVRVGYCLIFNPIINKVKEIIAKGTLGDIYYVQIYAGSYLPSWRTGVDYRGRYSAKKEGGGGVEYDLIHEINYAQFFFQDKITKVNSYLAKISNLEITSNDFAHFDIKQKTRFITITLSYFEQKPERYIRLTGDQATLFADLVEKTIEVCSATDKKIFSKRFDFDYNQMYIDEIKSMERFISGDERQMDILSIDQAIQDLKIVR